MKALAKGQKLGEVGRHWQHRGEQRRISFTAERGTKTRSH